MSKPVTLVFDIGKTTKKALLFDREFNVVDEKTEIFTETTDEEGFPCEDLQAVSDWVLAIIRHTTSDPSLNVGAINFSAYGASLVAVSRDGELIKPFYNYLKPFPEHLRERFFTSYNADNDLFEATASPWLGMLNSGLQAYWLKYEKPRAFNRIDTLLHLPQYFPFLVSKRKFCEKTSVGCHTMLWDFQNSDYHRWAKAEGISQLFPGVGRADEIFDLEFAGKKIRCGVGVHDSSAALMPYLVSMKQKFLLLSTGTWNICFNPFNKEPLTPEELRRDCLSYMTYQGDPVKASRIFLGHEHEVQQKELAAYFNVSADFYKSVSFNQRVFDALVDAGTSNKKFHPIGMEGTGPLPEKVKEKTDYAAFPDFEEAQHQLMRDLCQWQKIAIDLVEPAGEIKDLILVGGFSKSRLFLEVLKRELPDRKIYLSDHPRASALGAAWLVSDPDSYRECASLLKIIPL